MHHDIETLHRLIHQLAALNGSALNPQTKSDTIKNALARADTIYERHYSVNCTRCGCLKVNHIIPPENTQMKNKCRSCDHCPGYSTIYFLENGELNLVERFGWWIEMGEAGYARYFLYSGIPMLLHAVRFHDWQLWNFTTELYSQVRQHVRSLEILKQIREISIGWKHGEEASKLIRINELAEQALDAYDTCPVHGDISDQPGILCKQCDNIIKLDAA
jgi:hypothetical protein